MDPSLILTAITFTGTVAAERNTPVGPDGVDAESVKPSAHDEWLLDEALNETFPASDPISPSQPVVDS
jgi:hypothetical protein